MWRRAAEATSADVLEIEGPENACEDSGGELTLVVNGGPNHQDQAARAAALHSNKNGKWNGKRNGKRAVHDAETVGVDASGAVSLFFLEEAVPNLAAGGEASEVAEQGEQAEEKSVGMGFQGSLAGMLMLNLGAMLFGSNQVVIKTTESTLAPGTLSALRFCIAAMCFTPWIIKGLKDKKLTMAAAELGGWLFGGYTAQALGLFSTTAARGAFTGTFMVIAVPILVGLSGRHISKSTWLAAVGAMIGVGLLTTDGAAPNVGDLWCIISAVLFGVHKWRSEVITAEFEDTNGLVSLQILTLAVMSVVYVAPDLWHVVQESTVQEIIHKAQNLPWLPLGYMGLGTTALSLYLEMAALKEVSAPLAALIYTAEPLWGALFAYFFLSERWGATGWFGAALIVASSLFSQLVGDSEKLVTEKEKAH